MLGLPSGVTPYNETVRARRPSGCSQVISPLKKKQHNLYVSFTFYTLLSQYCCHIDFNIKPRTKQSDRKELNSEADDSKFSNHKDFKTFCFLPLLIKTHIKFTMFKKYKHKVQGENLMHEPYMRTALQACSYIMVFASKLEDNFHTIHLKITQLHTKQHASCKKIALFRLCMLYVLDFFCEQLHYEASVCHCNYIYLLP